MNQSTSNTNTTHEGAANGEASAKATGQRRYRRPARAKSTAAQPATATPLEVSTSVPVPSASTKTPATTTKTSRTEKTKRGAAKEPAAAGGAQLETASGPETAETATPPAPTPQPRPRTRRNNGRRNKGDVHLVVPPTPGGSAAEIAPSADAIEVPAEAYSLPTPVPVLTDPAGFDGSIPPSPALEPDEPLTPSEPAPRRYRFDRRAASSTPTGTTLRPERLTGLRSIDSSTEIPAAAETAPAPEALESTETPETPETVEEPFNFFAPHPAGTYTRGATGDDILSELGLGEARHASEPEDAEPEVGTDHDSDLYSDATLTSVPEPADTPDEMLSGAASGESESGTAARRRRRRRRSSPHVAGADEETPETLEAAEYPWSGSTPVSSTPSREPAGPPAAGRSYTGPAAQANHDTPPFPNYAPPEPSDQPSWDISSAQQYIRREDSPFGAPAPSFARGFGPQPRGVANPARDLYTARPARTDRGTDAPPMSPNQLANMVSSSIAQQTDRLLTELRYQQHPPSMTVMFPPLPSTERVGIFVDVANLLYSARSLRITIDFGRLLEFLRGNRRLIRAHAYAPTNPDPGADQSFLAAVKGMGYRITTKNYKTFSSGAKKADMDLDLCMDIVRLVDAGALDTVVLVSGDSDFLPLLEYCSDHGVRVEAAAFDDSAAMILRQSCDLFINLTVAADIRA